MLSPVLTKIYYYYYFELKILDLAKKKTDGTIITLKKSTKKIKFIV